jgi:hypothetical protein
LTWASDGELVEPSCAFVSCAAVDPFDSDCDGVLLGAVKTSGLPLDGSWRGVGSVGLDVAAGADFESTKDFEVPRVVVALAAKVPLELPLFCELRMTRRQTRMTRTATTTL